MKSCPTCNRTYSDETLSFCLIDGSVLSAPYNPKTLPLSPVQGNPQPPPTERLHLISNLADTKPPSLETTISAPPPVPYEVESKSEELITTKRNKSWVIMGLAALVLIVGFMIVNRTTWFKKGNPTIARESQSNTNATGNSITVPGESNATQVTPVVESSPAVANPNNDTSAGQIPQTTSSPAGTPPAMKTFDVTGTWSGRYFRAGATLIIKGQEDNSFSGTLRCVGFLVTIRGYLDQNTRRVTLKETNFVRTSSAKYDTWFLGTNHGLISSDGRTMSGSGKGRGSYSWVLSKQ